MEAKRTPFTALAGHGRTMGKLGQGGEFTEPSKLQFGSNSPLSQGPNSQPDSPQPGTAPAIVDTFDLRSIEVIS